MLKLVWIPKKYKNFSVREIVEEAESILKECKESEKENARLYADLIVLQNQIANLTEEQARKNLAVMISWLESQFPSLKEVE
ncbi:hypothetical protein MXL49_05795 [Enterococcus casseliflavus]|uniref:hypothetical protein n=1 Tax=Enterococcus casseliflavus TaxID=37734 RepID=UPI002DB77678|nr:hypothetical protein [Enterococcus casseliflavus]MEB6211399.1 hypothetical protein [Enterococcus casseliflavus]